MVAISRSRLRSAPSQLCEVLPTPLKFGERGLSYAGPATWNDLQIAIRQLTPATSFKQQLKTFLYHRVLPRDAMHSADCAVARCPSVCQLHAGMLSKRLNLSSNLFTIG